MKIGMQIVAPEGWGTLAKGLIYHFLRSDARMERVLLVQFECKPTGAAKANLLVLSRKNFEGGVKTGAIIPIEHQQSLPPWLTPLEGSDLSFQDRLHPNAKISKTTRVEDRLLHIASAVRECDSIFASKNPQAAINSRAAKCVPPQNELRFRLWFLTYLWTVPKTVDKSKPHAAARSKASGLRPPRWL